MSENCDSEFDSDDALEFSINDFKASESDEIEFTKDLFQFLYDEGYAVSNTMMEDFLILMSHEDEFSAERMEAVLRPIVVKSGKQDQLFHQSLGDFFIAEKERTAKYNNLKQRLTDKTEELQAVIQEKHDLSEKYEMASDINCFISEDEYKERTADPIRNDFVEIVEECAPDNNEFITNIDKCAAGYCTYDSSEAEAALPVLNDILRNSIIHEKAKDMMSYVADEIILTRKIAENKPTEKEMIQQTYEEVSQNAADLDNEVNALREQLYSSDGRDIYKNSSLNHRREFVGGKNAVHSEDDGEIIWMGKLFRKISAGEKKQIKRYISNHKHEFCSKLSRYVKSSIKKRINVHETCQLAMRTGGVPMRLSFKHQTPKRARILLILDISGSCSAASELMLTFMYYMKECISGGCLTYVFINKLYDVTDVFDEADSPESAIDNIMQSIARAGVYSNYGKAFKEFYDKEITKLNASRTFTFIIGDARNNNNFSGERYFKEICRKSQKTFWLNTEPKYQWDSGDSIISTYAKYVDTVVEVITPEDMFNMFQKSIC